MKFLNDRYTILYLKYNFADIQMTEATFVFSRVISVNRELEQFSFASLTKQNI